MKIKIINTQQSSRMLIISLLMLFTFIVSKAQTQYEWPSFHGPDQTNRSPETGLLKSWPEQGPQLVQTISGIGEGYSSVTIAGGMIFTAGSVNSQPFVYAFDMNGKLVWKKPVGVST